ncbi:MAG: hypothetical protein KDI09_05535 [Halioglobus sp.]|nr:hypothetical protein [Halioglobus sp.]
MRRGLSSSEREPVSEMWIVDTLTRLIFGDVDHFDSRESLVIDAFRSVDANVLRDTPAQMGDYLRNLGVREMIHLVTRIRTQIDSDASAMLGDATAGLATLHRRGTL